MSFKKTPTIPENSEFLYPEINRKTILDALCIVGDDLLQNSYEEYKEFSQKLEQVDWYDHDIYQIFIFIMNHYNYLRDFGFPVHETKFAEILNFYLQSLYHEPENTTEILEQPDVEMLAREYLGFLNEMSSFDEEKITTDSFNYALHSVIGAQILYNNKILEAIVSEPITEGYIVSGVHTSAEEPDKISLQADQNYLINYSEIEDLEHVWCFLGEHKEQFHADFKKIQSKILFYLHDLQFGMNIKDIIH